MSEIVEQIGQLIKTVRTQEGLTQKELAERLGVNVATVNRYETGKQNLTVDTIKKIAKAIGSNITVTFKP